MCDRLCGLDASEINILVKQDETATTIVVTESFNASRHAVELPISSALMTTRPSLFRHRHMAAIKSTQNFTAHNCGTADGRVGLRSSPTFARECRSVYSVPASRSRLLPLWSRSRHKKASILQIRYSQAVSTLDSGSGLSKGLIGSQPWSRLYRPCICASTFCYARWIPASTRETHQLHLQTLTLHVCVAASRTPCYRFSTYSVDHSKTPR